MLDMGALGVIILKEMVDANVVAEDARAKPAATLSTGASSTPAVDLPCLQEYLPQAHPQEEMPHRIWGAKAPRWHPPQCTDAILPTRELVR
jgi:hypothetical protein